MNLKIIFFTPLLLLKNEQELQQNETTPCILEVMKTYRKVDPMLPKGRPCVPKSRPKEEILIFTLLFGEVETFGYIKQ